MIDQEHRVSGGHSGAEHTVQPAPGGARKVEAGDLPRAIQDLRVRSEHDAEIKRVARAALSERLGYISDALELSVHDGVVVLTGDVENGNQKSIAEESIRKLAGDHSVVNHIRIMPISRLAMRTPRV